MSLSIPATSFRSTVPLDLRAQPFVQNDGFTPAHDLIINTKVIFAEYPLPADFDFTIPPSPNPSTTTMNPRQNSFGIMILDRLLNKTELAEATGDITKRKIFAYGQVTYTDVFDIERRSNFCFYFLWGSQGKPVWMKTQRHNDSN
jgi:hypothetical protein